MVAVGIITWFTLNSALSRYPKRDWPSEVEIFSPYPSGTTVSSSVRFSQRTLTQTECEDVK